LSCLHIVSGQDFLCLFSRNVPEKQLFLEWRRPENRLLLLVQNGTFVKGKISENKKEKDGRIALRKTRLGSHAVRLIIFARATSVPLCT
jgi:hypothetical protein